MNLCLICCDERDDILTLVGAGGGKKVIKGIIKPNTTDKILASDGALFEQTFKNAVMLNALTSIDMQTELNTLSLEKLKELEHYILHDKTTNNKKVAGIISCLPRNQNFESCQCKINNALDMSKTLAAAYFQKRCADEGGGIKIAKILKLVEGRIAVQEEVRMSD